MRDLTEKQTKVMVEGFTDYELLETGDVIKTTEYLRLSPLIKVISINSIKGF